MRPTFSKTPLSARETVGVWDRIRTSGPWHYHPECELALTLEGNGTRIVGDHIGTFQPGDLVLLGPNVPHVWSSVSKAAPRPFRLMAIHLTPRLLDSGIFELPEFHAAKRLIARAEHGLTFDERTAAVAARRMSAILAETGPERIASVLAVLEILAHAHKTVELSRSTFSPEIRADASARLERVYGFLLRNFRRKVSLDEVCSAAHMSRAALCRFVRRHVGKPLNAIVNDMRIGHACSLLQKGTHNASQAAYDSGFNNLAHFNRQFLRITGLTPRQYRAKFADAAGLIGSNRAA